MNKGTLVRISAFLLCMFTIFFTIVSHGTMTVKRVIVFVCALVMISAVLFLSDKWCEKGADIKNVLSKSVAGHTKWIDILVCAIVIFISLYIRICFIDFETEDGIGFFSVWIEKFRALGIKESLGANITNYSQLATTILIILSLIPAKALTVAKILPIVCDYGIGVVGISLYNFCKGNNTIPLGKVCVLACLLLNPISVLNSSAWGQWDSTYTFFVLLGVYYLIKLSRNNERCADLAVAMFALAFSLKLQAIFAIPALMYYYVSQRRGENYRGIRLSHFIWFPMIYFASAIPMFLSGKTLESIFTIYAKEVNAYNHLLSLNYANCYALIGDRIKEINYHGYFIYGILLAFVILLLFYYVMFKNEVGLNARNIMIIVVITVLTLNYFLPSMHERYAYVAEILIIILACAEKRFVVPALLTHICTLSSYAHYLTEGLGTEIPTFIVAMIRLGVLVFLLFELLGGKDDKLSIGT